MLAAVVGAREGRAGEVGVEDAELAGRVVFDEPGEAGAEHGGCGGDEGFSEGGEGGEAGEFDLLDHCFGGGFGVWCLVNWLYIRLCGLIEVRGSRTRVLNMKWLL